MKKLSLLLGFAGLLSFAACRQNAENGGEEVRGNSQRSDTAVNINNNPNSDLDTTQGTGNGNSNQGGNNNSQGSSNNSSVTNNAGNRIDSGNTKTHSM